jgi:hypothetical protein
VPLNVEIASLLALICNLLKGSRAGTNASFGHFARNPKCE